MISYLTSIDTIPLSRTVLEIIDFKIFRVWPRTLTPEGHLGSRRVKPFGSPYMTSFLTSMNTLSLSRTVFEIFDFKVFRVWPWPSTPKGHLGSNFFNHSKAHICPGNDAKLIRRVLSMTLNSSVVVQGMTFKLRPCLRFRACGWGCVRWEAPCRKGCGWFVKLTWLALLSMYYIL